MTEKLLPTNVLQRSSGHDSKSALCDSAQVRAVFQRTGSLRLTSCSAMKRGSDFDSWGPARSLHAGGCVRQVDLISE